MACKKGDPMDRRTPEGKAVAKACEKYGMGDPKK